MKIAFFTDSYLPQRDGVASITSGLARTLVRQGHAVRVVAPSASAGAPSGEEVDGGVRIRRLRSVPVPLYGQYRWPVFPFGLLRTAVGGADADIVHLHTPGAIGSMGFLVARRFDRPLVGTFHTNLRAMAASVPQKLLVPLFFRIAWWYNLGTYWRCDRATAPSQAARAVLLESARKPFRAPVAVIPNGVDTERFRPGARVPDWRARCGLGEAPLVTYLGRLTVDKGVHRFLDAIRRVAARTPVGALVGGAGPEEARVRDRIAAEAGLAGRVRYVGPVAESEKAALLGQSDLFVLPSTSDTSSVALLEAMACGTTVVAPEIGGPSEVVVPGVTGITTDVASVVTLAATIERLASQPELRTSIGAAAARWVRAEGSLDAMAGRFISLYRLVLEEPGPRAGRIAA